MGDFQEETFKNVLTRYGTRDMAGLKPRFKAMDGSRHKIYFIPFLPSYSSDITLQNFALLNTVYVKDEKENFYAKYI